MAGTLVEFMTPLTADPNLDADDEEEGSTGTGCWTTSLARMQHPDWHTATPWRLNCTQ